MTTVFDCDFPCVDHLSTLSVSSFYQQYALTGQPVVVKDVAQHWPAVHRWGARFFSSLCNACEWEVLDQSGAGERVISFIDFYRYMIQPTQTRKELLYLADYDFKTQHPSLLKDMGDVAWAKINWLAGQPERVAWPTLFIGPEKSFSVLHSDIYDSHAWNTVLKGTKRFLIFSQTDSAMLAEHFQQHPEKLLSLQQRNFFNVTLSELPWFENTCPRVWDLKPGETLFTPGKCFHAVVNMEDDTTAVTGNWVDITSPFSSFEQLEDRAVEYGIRLTLSAITQNKNVTLSETLEKIFCKRLHQLIEQRIAQPYAQDHVLALKQLRKTLADITC